MRRFLPNAIAGRVLWALGLTGVCLVMLVEQAGAEYAYLRYARTHLRFGVFDGRIGVAVVKASSFAPPPSKSGGRSEQVAIQYDFRTGAAVFRYQLTAPEEAMSIAASTDGQVTARHEPKGIGQIVTSEFSQPPSGPLVLSFGSGDKKRTYTAPTIWHLLLAHRGACNQYLVPFLRILQPEWRLIERADQVEAELLRAASRGTLPDQSRWAELVAQLGDDQYARREAADRQLRSLGQPVVAYLKGLPREKLDAEQQYRIQRIIETLTGMRGDESAQQIASTLLGEPTVWLILLERESPSTRRLAAVQLGRLLGRPIDFDPTGDAALRKRQIEALRERVSRGP